MKPGRVGAVVNPVAGDGDAARRYGRLAACFPEATVDARITTGPGDVAVAAREQAADADLVVAIGGDGTLREVAAALYDAGSTTPLFVVPAGRGNSSYRHLYGDRDWQRVAAGLADGIEPRPVELGRLEADPPVAETYFLLGFSAGLFRGALAHAAALRWLPGPVAYVVGTARAALVDPPVEAAVAVDSERLFTGRARLVAVGGGRYRGRNFELFPASRPGDDRLHVVVVEPAGLRRAVGAARLARRGRLADHSAVVATSGQTVTVTSPDGLPVEVDGTRIEQPVTEARLSVVPDAIAIAEPTPPSGATGK